jgi:DNA helicase-2/ATP-dependent DNA helicase PcrA
VRDLLLELQEQVARDESVAEILTTLLKRTHYLDHLAGERDGKGEDRAANVNEFLLAAEDFDQRFEAQVLERENDGAAQDGSTPDVERDEFSDDYLDALPTRLAVFLETVVLEDSGERTNLPSEDSAPESAVTLMTLHAAKGLEFPVVFLVGAEQGILPHARALWGETSTPAELEEERRLCYVGLTRAEEKVFLTHAAQRTLHGRTEAAQPSQFIDEIPSQLLKRSGFAKMGGLSYGAQTTDWSTPFTTTEDFKKAEQNNEPPQYEIGDRVRHPSFGEGVVTNAATRGGAGEWVEIGFLSGEVGKKKLIVAYAPLEKLS